MALFSLVFFRPFVYTVLGVGALVKLLRLGRLLAFTDRMFGRVLGAPNEHVLPTVAGLMITTLAIILLMGLGGFAYETWQADAFPAFALSAILAATFIPCAIYRSNRPFGGCKVEVYVRAVMPLCILAAFALEPAGAVYSFIGLPLAAITGIWGALCFAAVNTWAGIVIAASWLCTMLWEWRASVTWLVGAAIVAGIYGWIAMRYFGGVTALPTQKAIDRRERLDELATCLYYETPNSWAFATWFRLLERLGDTLWNLISDPDWTLDKLTPEQREQIKREAEALWRAEQEKERIREEKCRRMTEAVGRLLTPFTWVGRQLRILASYLWALVKARKQGLCPYLQFHD